MARNFAYWVSTILVAGLAVLSAFVYLSGSPQAIQGFTHIGYPQRLRIILGIAKRLGAIALLTPGFPRLKSGPMPDSHSPGFLQVSRST